MGKRSVVVALVLGVLAVLAPLAGPARAEPMSITTTVVGKDGGDHNVYDGTALGPDFAGGEWHILRKAPDPGWLCAGSYTGWWDLSDASGNRLVGTLTEQYCPAPNALHVGVTQLTVTGGEGRYAGVTGSGTLTGRFHYYGAPDPYPRMAGLVQLSVENTGSPPPPARPKPFSGQAVLHDPAETEQHYTGQVTSTEGSFQLTIDLDAIRPPPSCEYSTYQEGTFVLDDGQGNRLSGSVQSHAYGPVRYQLPTTSCHDAVTLSDQGWKGFYFFGDSGTGRFANGLLEGPLSTTGASRAELTGTISLTQRK